MAKAKMMEEEDQGWSYTDKFVCIACVDDYALEEAIRADETAESVCAISATGAPQRLSIPYSRYS